MKVLTRIRSFLRAKSSEEIQDFEDFLLKRYGFDRYLYATSEGLPIMGNFSGYETLSAKVPEMFKILSDLEESDTYIVRGKGRIHLLIRITPEVLLLAETRKEPSPPEINELIARTREELGL
ncbi:hypothetical protein [Thermococcus sp.]|uniref:hypothetical protein n=1 Tax=Thermococcus sp. TaxID=35749 RepID=UPI00261C9D94|nr:hypothetical protein [Thermococcus sp.]